MQESHRATKRITVIFKKVYKRNFLSNT